jgi:hypothetical protein
VQIPLCHIPEPVRNTASDWINQRSPDALGDFVMWCIDSIMSELSGQAVGAKGSKKAAQQTPRAQVVLVRSRLNSHYTSLCMVSWTCDVKQHKNALQDGNSMRFIFAICPILYSHQLSLALMLSSNEATTLQ